MSLRNMICAAAALAVMPVAAVTVGPDWCVAYPDNQKEVVNRALKVAAEEVADDINEATGLKLKAIPASKAKPPAIYLGAKFAKEAGLDLSGLKWYANAITEKGGSIYLYGNDIAGRDAAKFGWNIGWFRCVLPSVRAATRFLETHVGVRFLMPGEVGKEVPKVKEVSVADGSATTENPPLIYGSGRSAENKSMMYYIANGLWGMGPFHTYGGHTYPDACPPAKYAKTHPEYFALWKGKRMCNEVCALCISNPEVEELVVAELKRQFDSGAKVCQLAQNDGAFVCECEKCRAMYGTGDDWCEKLWLFHRHIAERIQKECPGKIVHILSYGKTVMPPKTFKEFPSNVMIELCAYGEDGFAAWDGYVVPHGFTVYTYLSGSYLRTGFTARHPFAFMATLAKRFHENKVRGIYRCGGCGDLYGTEGPAYYVFNKLLMDGSQSVNALVADYCSAAFGPAADLMRRFYETQDARLRAIGMMSNRFRKSAAPGLDAYLEPWPKNSLDLHGWIYSPDTIALMEESLARAEKTGGLSAKHRKRLELVRLQFDYAKLMGEISTLYSAYKLRPSEAFLAPLLKAVEDRNDYLDRLYCGGKRPRNIEGWPELKVFGTYSDVTRSVMNVNGVMSAVIGAPLTWSTKKMAGVLPGATVKKTEASRTDAPPTFADFAVGSGWNELGGITMEKVPMKARFRALYDERALYLLVESDLADGVELKGFMHDGPIWNDDCVDILVAPGATRDVYYHFIYGESPVSRYDAATGLIKDPLDPMYGKADVTWSGRGWKTESRREGGKWRTIATFPYSDFGVAAPKPGDSWFINVGRIAKTGEGRKEETLMLWSPNAESRSMVAPNAMGKIVFR